MAKDGGEAPGMETPFSPFYPPGSRERLEFDLSRTLVAAARLWTTLLDSTLKESIGNRARWATLLWIEFADGPATTMSLAGILKVQWATIVRIVGALEQEGLVAREGNPNDGRSSILKLTPEGRALLKSIPQQLDPIRSEALRPFEDDSLESMLEMLNALRDNALKMLK